MIEVNERFEVPSSAATVWRLLADPHAVVGCVPGAAIVAESADGALETSLSVKFGPLSVTFEAHAELELDEVAMRGVISARGRDKQGGARFKARTVFTVTPAEAGSIVQVGGEVDLTGHLASLIESAAGIVVKRMSAEFAECLRARCAALTTS